tara:strand:+ start:178 stop:546 length:369 start_codon:yes stop_codon:yes gene_type:complete
MKFINECTQNLHVGQLAQFNDAGLIDTLSTGRRLGICTSIKTVSVSDDVTTTEILVAEIATTGDATIPLNEAANWQGCELYQNGSALSTAQNGSPIAYLIPKGLGDEKVDYMAGDLASIVML